MTRPEGWGRALSKAAVALGASLGGIVLVTEILISSLSIRVSPLARDVLVTAWFAVCLALLSFLFVRLQPEQDADR